MRFNFKLQLLIALLISIHLISCKGETEDFATEPVSEYMPLEVGKYITYRIDSLVFVDFQRFPEVHQYQVKHVVDAEVTDNLGRKSYRIYRYLNNEDGSGEWVPDGTYFITPLRNRIEVIEDNLRIIKLQAPMREGTSWKGNSYLPTDAYDPFGYNFSNDDDMQNWEFYVQQFESGTTINGQNYTDVYTIEQQNDFSNVPIADPLSYGYKNRATEKYSRGIGLVYREYEMWEYQPNLSGPDPYYSGFGVTMWMIDHN
ncbi:MAG: hypothetical protein NVV59_04885 [Chitinophagaceae bacterium]|nr:hypothetical protein [Chitinophagaceae bacterium]